MVEVFKTDVNNYQHAQMLIERIHEMFIQYKANFDLEDCDNILRVKCTAGEIQVSGLIRLLNDLGFHAEVLEDEYKNRTALHDQTGYPNLALRATWLAG